MKTIDVVLSYSFAGMKVWDYHELTLIPNVMGHMEIITQTRDSVTMAEINSRSAEAGLTEGVLLPTISQDKRLAHKISWSMRPMTKYHMRNPYSVCVDAQ